LGAALDSAALGRLTVVLLEGEPGIGKTRLLAEVLADARRRGMQVASGAAEELEHARPFGLVAGMLECTRTSPDPRRAAIADLLTAGDRTNEPVSVTSDPGMRFRAVDAFADLAEELALSGPLLLGVDDLQWADPASLLTLATVRRRLSYLPVALIGCLRPTPRSAELERLVTSLEAAGGRRLPLAGLAPDAVRELVTEAVAADPGPGLLSEVEGAGGNPLFITELLAALAQEGAITTSGGWAEVGTVGLPPTLRLTIVRRLSFLPEDTLQVLRAASILGSKFTVTDLSTTTARAAHDLSQLLAPALDAGVLGDGGAHLRFRHDLIREAIYEDVPLSVRRALHREAGQRLADTQAPALQIAEHLNRGAEVGDADAVTWLTRAARELAPTSPGVAADLMAAAVGLTNPADASRDSLLVEQASSLMWAGKVTAATEMCRELLARPHDEAAEGSARLCLGFALVAQSRSRDALPELDRAALSPDLSASERARALAWAGYARLTLADLDGAVAIADEVLTVAPSDPLATSVALATQALRAIHRLAPAGALAIVDDAVRLADRSTNRLGHRFPIHVTRGFVLTELDRLQDAIATLEVGRRIGEELGIHWHLSNYLIITAMTRFLAGEWDDAIAEVDAARDLAEESGEGPSLILGNCAQALIWLHRNDLGRARQSADAAMAQLGEPGTRYRALWAMWADALLLEAEGHAAEAFKVLADCWDRCAQWGLTLDYRAFGPDLVRLARIVGDHERARIVADAMTETAAKIADHSDIPSLTGAALRCRGMVEGDADTLQASVDAYARSARPLELALACEDAGAAFIRDNDTGRGRELLDKAVGHYERLGARRDLARVDAVLREAGIRRGRRVARSRPQSGWRSLTPTEELVAGLVAEGLTNPQIGDRLFISRRTVQAHLAHIFLKLDLTSRSQLASIATQHRDQQGTEHR
jgi:DNA-binding CsgD family transcriptional regulator/tetratricopeptide (TPR) repeat protein